MSVSSIVCGAISHEAHIRAAIRLRARCSQRKLIVVAWVSNAIDATYRDTSLGFDNLFEGRLWKPCVFGKARLLLAAQHSFELIVAPRRRPERRRGACVPDCGSQLPMQCLQREVCSDQALASPLLVVATPQP